MLEKDYKKVIQVLKQEIAMAQYQAAVSVNEHLKMYCTYDKKLSKICLLQRFKRIL